LYGTAGCPYTREMREWLEWNRREYVEFDVESDAAARERMRAIDKSVRTVPVLVQDGKIVQIGFGGRGCIVA
jgi:glutaredoxin